jgi:hypothetical protein
LKPLKVAVFFVVAWRKNRHTVMAGFSRNRAVKTSCACNGKKTIGATHPSQFHKRLKPEGVDACEPVCAGVCLA